MMPSTGITAILSEPRLCSRVTSCRRDSPGTDSPKNWKNELTKEPNSVKTSKPARTNVATIQPRPVRRLGGAMAGETSGGGRGGGGAAGADGAVGAPGGGFGGGKSLSITKRSYCMKLETGKSVCSILSGRGNQHCPVARSAVILAQSSSGCGLTGRLTP